MQTGALQALAQCVNRQNSRIHLLLRRTKLHAPRTLPKPAVQFRPASKGRPDALEDIRHTIVKTDPLGPRSLDPRIREFVTPTRIVWTSPAGVFEPGNLLAQDDSVCRMEAASGAAVVLDYGRELHGGVRLDVPSTTTGKRARVRVRFGESVSEAMGEPNNDHTIHDFDMYVAWMGHVEIGCTGFRFVRLDLLDDETSIDLRSAPAVYLHRDSKRLGSFTCSDPRLNEVWEIGARTVHLCMQDQLWDAVKRDRLAWIGDIHPETRVISAVFGQDPLVQESLDYVRDRTPLPGWMNGVSSYSLWWIITQHDWYRYHGDRAYLSEQKDYLTGLLERLDHFVDEQGFEKLDGWRFLEWPTAEDQEAIAAGLQALLSIAYDRAEALLEELQEEDLARHAREMAAKTAACRRPSGPTKQANALLALAGMGSPHDINEKVLSVDPFRGLSTYYGYYILEARARAGDYAGCLDLIRNYWGGMLDMGASTFWEHFEIDWMENGGRVDELVPDGKVDIHRDRGAFCYEGLRHSLCHGWAAGPTAWLSEHVLGVRPTSPGFATVTVEPHLDGLKWAHGTVPTPYGPLEVIHERTVKHELWTRVKAPRQIHVEGHKT